MTRLTVPGVLPSSSAASVNAVKAARSPNGTNMTRVTENRSTVPIATSA